VWPPGWFARYRRESLAPLGKLSSELIVVHSTASSFVIFIALYIDLLQVE